MPGTNGETAIAEPSQQLAHTAFVQFDAELGGNAVTKIDTPEAHNAVAGQIGTLLYPGRKLALFDPAQAGWPAATCPVRKPFQACLVVAVNPVA